MAADHLQFLKKRFMREFHEAEEEFGGEFPLLHQFHDIQRFLERRSINPFTPIVMKNGLYDLIHELKECIMLAEKERDRQKERTRRIQNMKSRFRVHTYEIQTRIMMTKTNVTKRWFIYTTRKKLLRIKRNLELVKDDDVAAESSLLSNSVEVWSSWNSSWIRRQATREIHGFDDELKKIKALLLRPADDGIKTIGIVGMSGVGKTTLAKMVVNDPNCRTLFSPTIWVTLSQHLNPSDLMRQLLETFSAHDNDAQIIIPDSLPGQLRELKNRLWGKKYLIVLDNVWHQNDWYSDLRTDGTICMNRLCHGLPKGGGGVEIVTSGLEEVATSMVGEHNLFRLQPLFNQEALWSIFMDLIRRKKFLTCDHRQRLERMKDEIIYRCDGLPLAAKTLAEIISIQSGKEEYWSITDVKKKFLLRLDPFDGIFYDEAIKKVRNLGGVEDVSSANLPIFGEITIIGRCLPVEIARELGKLLHTELISVRDISQRYALLKLDLHNNKDERKAMKIVSNISGIDSISMDMNEKKLLVFGDVDPEEVVSKLRKYWHTDIILLGPVKRRLQEKIPVDRHLQEKRLGKRRRLRRLENQLTDFQNGVVLSGPTS